MQTAQTICDLARQIAKCPGYGTQSGQMLNTILAELATDYDFDILRVSTTITLNSGSGPYNLPADYYRARPNDVLYTIDGVPYNMINIDLAEYDNLVQQPGMQSYPTMFATNMSTTPPTLLVWPPSSGSFVCLVRYQSKPADIATPESNSALPWFPNDVYLVTRLAGELMKITNDDRASRFLGDEPGFGARDILRSYLKMKDDPEGRAKTVSLDRRRFGNAFSGLPNTKMIGW